MDQNLLSALEEAAARIPVINPTRQYWFIRTNGGDFYTDFWETNSVGIGYNLITLAAFKKAIAQKRDPQGELYIAVLAKYETDQPGRIAGLLSRFLIDMKPGDIVIMPSGGSQKLAFGEVTDGLAFEIDTDVTDDDVIYRKRRSVKWLVERTWQELDSNLYGAFVAPQAFTNVTRYDDLLDREIHSIYTKAGETHFRLDIKTSGGIDGEDYFEMGNALLSLCQEFRGEVGIAAKGSKVEVRSNVQSPGMLEFIAANPAVTVFLASVVTVGLFGGRVVIESWGLNVGTDGLFKSISNFMMENTKREMMKKILEEKLPQMEASVTSDLVLRLSGAAPSAPSLPPSSAPSTSPQNTPLPPLPEA